LVARKPELAVCGDFYGNISLQYLNDFLREKLNEDPISRIREETDA
jgi:hypothetical protein